MKDKNRIANGQLIFGDIGERDKMSFSDLYDSALSNAPPNTGDLITFTGIVRNTSSESAKSVEYLVVEAWNEGAFIMEAIARKIFERHSLTLCYIYHLTGTLKIGDPIVYVVLGSEHREEGFEALRDIILLYKKDAPVWKKEVYSDGTGRWISAAGSSES